MDEESTQAPQDSSEETTVVARGDDEARGATRRPPPVVAQLYAPLTVVSTLGLAAAALFGLSGVAAAALGVALVNDWVAVYSNPGFDNKLAAVGLRHPQRAMLRSLMVAVAIGVAAQGESALLVLYGLAGVTANSLGIFSHTLVGWALGRAPMLGVRNIGEQLELHEVFARARRNRPSVPYVELAIEWLVVVGIAVALSTPRPLLVGSIVTAAGLALMVAWTWAVYQWAQRLRGGTRTGDYEHRLFDELRAYAPEVIVYLSAAPGSGYMLNQWLPALTVMPRRALILLRERSNVDSIAETSLPVILAPETRDVERMLLPSVRIAIYVANAGRNVHLLREAAIKHVFLNHGDSDKSTSANPVARVYDEVWVAGEAAIDRYEAAGVDIPREHFAIIGRPQVDSLPVGPRPAKAERRVLYAPTWEGIYDESNYSSLEVAGVTIIQAILAEQPELGIIFKPHPASGAWRPGMRTAITEIERLLSESPNADRHLIADAHPGMTLTDCFTLADVLISDVSSVVTDFLQTERPILTSNPKSLDVDEFRRTFPTQTASYILGPDFEAAPPLLDTALGEDPLVAERREMKRYVLGDLPQGPLKAFGEHADRICHEAERHAERVRNNFTFTEAVAHTKRGTPERLSLYQKLRARA